MSRPFTSLPSGLAALGILALISLWALPAVAQERTLTLEDALERARTQSHQVRMNRADLRRADLAVDEARAGRLPSVTLDGQYMANLSLPVIVLPSDSPFGEGVLRTGNRHNISATAQVAVPVYNAQLSRSIDLSRAARGLERTLAEATLREVEIEVRRAYLNGLTTREVYEVLQQSHETLQRNLALVEALHAEGVVPEYDLIRTEVQVRNMEPEISRARNNQEGALNYLKLLTAIPIDEEVHLAADLEDFYDELAHQRFEPAFDDNRDLLQVQGQRTLLEHQLALERAAYRPTVSAFGNFTYQGQGDGPRFWDYQWNDTAAVGVGVSFPLFVGGRRQRIEQVEIESMQAQMQLEFLSESLHSQFDTTRRRIDDLQATIAAQERTIEQAQRGFDIARTSYEEGVHTLMDVNDAESALTEARLNRKTALADFVHAILDMEELVGDSTGPHELPGER